MTENKPELMEMFGPMTAEEVIQKYPDRVLAHLKEQIEEINRLRADLAKPSEWISVKEALPIDGERVLFYNGAVVFGRWLDGAAWDTMQVATIKKLTHWKHLPSPPDKA